MSAGQDNAANRAEQTLQEAEALIWALLDDRIEDADATRLGALIEQDAAVRARYIDCVQLHVDLQELFNGQAEQPQAEKPEGQIFPTLLMGGMPGTDSFQPLPE